MQCKTGIYPIWGARPFGISILFAGVDDGEPVLFETEPTGMFFQYKATAIGEGDVEIKKIFEKDYKENMDIEEGFSLAVKALKKVLEKDFDLKRVDGAYIKSNEGKFVRVDANYLRRVLK